MKGTTKVILGIGGLVALGALAYYADRSMQTKAESDKIAAAAAQQQALVQAFAQSGGGDGGGGMDVGSLISSVLPMFL